MSAKTEKLRAFDKFIGSIRRRDKIAVFFDTDPDGISSAAVAAAALKRIRGKLPDTIRPVHHSDFADFGKTFRKKRFDVAIILDLPLDSLPREARALGKRARVLNLDHHKLYREISSRKTLLIKPQMYSGKEPAHYPTAKMCFDFFSRHADISDLDWLVAVGIIGDHSWEEWAKFLRQAAKRNKVKMGDLFEMKSVAGAFLSMHEGKARELFAFLLRAKGPKEFLKSGFAKHLKKFRGELKKELKIAERKAERNAGANLIFYVFRPKFSLKNAVVSSLSEANPEKNVVVVEDDGKKFLRASARRQDFRVSMGELMESAVKGLKGGRGGGHVPAAGASFARSDLEKFRRNLARILSAKEK